MTKSTVTGVRGSPLPNLELHGFAGKMKEAKKLIDEQDRLRRRKSELGQEQMRLREEIKQREREHTREWGRAMRAGEDAPADKGRERASRRLEEVGKEIAAISHAGDLSTAELQATVAEHAQEWDSLVQNKAQEILSEAQRMADQLSAKLAETDHLVGIHSWLVSSGMNYQPASPTSLSIEDLLLQRRTELGLLDDVGVPR